jgi:chemotaxis protein methyltransferase CheR
MTTEISSHLLDQLSDYVAERMGLHFPPSRRRDLEQGVLRAAPEFGFDNVESCVRWLLLSPLTKTQVEILASYLTVGETYFFRDGKSFEVLEGQILPELIRTRSAAGRYLRIWSAGCATGEEAYSIAILLRRMIPDFSDWNITILATDINPSFLHRASVAVYGEWSFREVPSWTKERYFRKTKNNRYEILPGIKKQVTFSYLNLAEDAYPSLMNNTNAMDIIFCRNVLMYFSRQKQKEVVLKLHRCLIDGGLLISSPSESSAELFSAFRQVHYSGVTLYQRAAEETLPAERPAWEEPLPLHLSMPLSPVIEPTVKPGAVVAGPSPATALSVSEAESAALHPDDLYRESHESYERGKYADAEGKIRKLLAGAGDHAPALALFARLHANMGRLPDARELCERAIAEDKLNARYHYLLSSILEEMGLAQEAASSLKRALYLDHNFILAHFALGNLARKQGKATESGKHFENALSVLSTVGQDSVIPESEGITARRLTEIIRTMMLEDISA